jgi:hypothetical protein
MMAATTFLRRRDIAAAVDRVDAAESTKGSLSFALTAHP